MDDYTVILNKLRTAKRYRGLTNKQIADRSGHSEKVIARLFRGENTNLYAFFDACKAMGIEVRIV